MDHAKTKKSRVKNQEAKSKEPEKNFASKETHHYTTMSTSNFVREQLSSQKETLSKVTDYLFLSFTAQIWNEQNLSILTKRELFLRFGVLFSSYMPEFLFLTIQKEQYLKENFLTVFVDEQSDKI